MKRLLLIIPLFCLLTITGFAQGVCQRHTEIVGGFSLCVPDGWSVVAREGHKYKILHGERGLTFTPNINIKDEANTGSLADYATASVKLIEMNYQRFGATSVKLVAREDFQTTTGKPAIKVTFSTQFKGILVRTQQFYLDGKLGRKLIVTCTGAEAEKATLDPLFERALKSFRLEN